MTEADFLTALRALPLHAGAHGLTDDAAHLGDLVLTKDLIVAGVHFLPGDPPPTSRGNWSRPTCPTSPPRARCRSG